MRPLLALLLVALGSIGGVRVMAEGVLPPAPTEYVTDHAGVIPAAEIDQLNQRLAAFERETSDQIVTVIYPKLPEGVTLEDYAQQLYTAWKIGTKKDSNGVLILVFIQDHKIRIQTGYGLEGTLPDALCSRIIRENMGPSFRAGFYGAGLDLGIKAVLRAINGNATGGSGGHHEQPKQYHTLREALMTPNGIIFIIFFILFCVVFVWSLIKNVRATFFSAGGSGGGGGFSGGGGGGFSGGGGSSGGGGASGGW